MILPAFFDPKKSLQLFGLSDKFNFLKKLYKDKRLPKVLMLSGKIGSGKSTLVNHLMYFIFDEKNYNEKKYEYFGKSSFYNQYLNNFYSNVIYLSGSDFKNVKIEDIRNLKNKIFQTTILAQPRFIVLDDVELFNNNSLNALLKVIEEPSNNNHFILINNKSKPLIQTIYSRCLDIKIILNSETRQEIITAMIDKFSIECLINYKTTYLTPGQFIKFNYICNEKKILPTQDFLKNLGILLNLYKKDKDIILIDMILFLTDSYFTNLKNNKSINNEKIISYKMFVFKNINKFFLYNLNQNALLNNISNRINNE
jgi:DNA polymerase III subunit delta'